MTSFRVVMSKKERKIKDPMKYFKLLLIVSLIHCSTVFSQEKLIKHTVKKGETITAIAQKYKVDPTAIYELNPDCSRVLKLESIILIPRPTSNGTKTKTKIAVVADTHEVQPKETLYSIAKQYEITLEEINTANPELAETGLQAGQKIKIPAKLTSKNSVVAKKEEPKVLPKKEVVLEEKKLKTIPVTVASQSKTIMHEVLPSETKFGIAKQYGISITDLDSANPILEKEPLKIGQKITIPVKEGSVVATPVVQPTEVIAISKIQSKETPKEVVVVTKEVAVEPNQETVVHEVLPKETKYGIAKKYGISVTELETQNPSILKNLYVGAKLTIAGAKAVQETTADVKVVSSESNDAVLSQENLTIATSVAKWNTNEELADELIRMASDNLGTRYRSGGTSKNGFDCSGLMYSTFSSLDIKLPRSSHEMASIGNVVAVHEAKKGDLIFFKTRGGSQINHVGMVVEVSEGEIKFIHSATHGGVIISSTKEKYYEKNFTQINRVLQQ
jgi:cell wall-associated NlpC family hydrolase